MPEIRLKGFTEPWVQRKLGDVADIRTGPFGSALHAEDYVSDGIPIITTEHFKSGMLPKGKANIPQVSDDDYKRLHSYILNTDDIVFSRVGSIDINALVSDIQNGWLFSGRVLRVRTHDNVNSQYLHYELSTVKVKNDIITRAVGQTMPSINTEILKETTIFFPIDVDEQIAIGEFFRALDENITLHKQKLDSLKKLKKGYLQQMFPQTGEVVPRVRFEGFTEPWTQRKLGEYTKLITKGTTPIDKSGNGEINFIKVENIINGEIKSTSKISVEEHNGYLKRSRLKEGDILFSIAGTLGRTAVVGKLILPANTNQALAIIRDYDFDTNFLVTSFSAHVVSEYVKKNPTIGAQPNLSLEQIGDLIICTPSRMEQMTIGNFFHNLSNQITTQTQKLEQLKQLKTAYLQKMFV